MWGNGNDNDSLLEDALLMGAMGGNRRRRQTDIVSEVFEVEAVEDLMDGNVGGFVEDEFLADIL